MRPSDERYLLAIDEPLLEAACVSQVELQHAASAAWGASAWWHPGGLAWNRPVSIAEVGDGWVWSDGETAALLGTVTPGAVEVARRLGALHLVHHEAIPLPEVADLPFSLDVRRPAEEITLTPIRGVRLGQVEDSGMFIACHRAAWNPHALPFAIPRTFRAEAASSFDAARWDIVRNDPWFDPDLVVVAYENDEPVASCIVWYDARSGAAEIEPLGVVPRARGRGLARLVTQEAVRRVASRRGREVVVRPRGDDEYPVPRAVYAACGFVVNQRDRVYRLD